MGKYTNRKRQSMRPNSSQRKDRKGLSFRKKGGYEYLMVDNGSDTGAEKKLAEGSHLKTGKGVKI